jgi:carbon monoxide dehydrogenase subunit G
VVWTFVSNPEKIAKCLPDLQSLEVRDSRNFTVTLKLGIAFVRGTLKFDFTLLEQETPIHSRFEGNGRGAGVSVRLEASIYLNEIDPATTELVWKTDAELGGLLGEISSSLIQSSTNKFTQQFFDCIKSQLESAS